MQLRAILLLVLTYAMPYIKKGVKKSPTNKIALSGKS